MTYLLQYLFVTCVQRSCQVQLKRVSRKWLGPRLPRGVHPLNTGGLEETNVCK